MSNSKDRKSNSRNKFLRTFSLGTLGSGLFGFSSNKVSTLTKKQMDNKLEVVINELAIKRNNNKG